jgi:hypothetical protein
MQLQQHAAAGPQVPLEQFRSEQRGRQAAERELHLTFRLRAEMHMD